MINTHIQQLESYIIENDNLNNEELKKLIMQEKKAINNIKKLNKNQFKDKLKNDIL